MNIIEILKNLKRKNPRDLRCPNCGGKNVHRIFSMQWLAPSPFLCKDCGYTGYLLISIDEETKDEKVNRT